jgi:hypothetical protein
MLQRWNNCVHPTTAPQVKMEEFCIRATKEGTLRPPPCMQKWRQLSLHGGENTWFLLIQQLHQSRARSSRSFSLLLLPEISRELESPLHSRPLPLSLRRPRRSRGGGGPGPPFSFHLVVVVLLLIVHSCPWWVLVLLCAVVPMVLLSLSPSPPLWWLSLAAAPSRWVIK